MPELGQYIKEQSSQLFLSYKISRRTYSTTNSGDSGRIEHPIPKHKYQCIVILPYLKMLNAQLKTM